MRLRALPRCYFEQAGEHVAALLGSRYAPDGPVALFGSRDHEIDTRPIDAWLRDLGVPRALPTMVDNDLVFRLIERPIDQLARDTLGIPTPAEDCPVIHLSACALALLPGLAFDGQRGRLGYGRGFYDRALASSTAPTAGILTDAQWVERVPMDAWDLRPDQVISPLRAH